MILAKVNLAEWASLGQLMSASSALCVLVSGVSTRLGDAESSLWFKAGGNCPFVLAIGRSNNDALRYRIKLILDNYSACFNPLAHAC